MRRRDFMVGMAGLMATAMLPRFGQTAEKAGCSRCLTGIDSHAHVFKTGLQLVEKRRYAPDYNATLDDYLENLDRSGLSHGVLIQPSFLGENNGFLLECLKARPDRLRGIVVISPNSSKETLLNLDKQGVVGIRLNLVGLLLPDLTSKPWPGLLKNIADLGWQVEVHRQASDLPYIVDPLLKSGVTVVVDHFGRPDAARGIYDSGFRYLLAAASTRRLWIKVSAAYRNGENGEGEALALKAMPLLKDAFGLERLVWGSDWPHTQFEKTENFDRSLSLLTTLLPDPLDRKAMLVDSPAALFRFA